MSNDDAQGPDEGLANAIRDALAANACMLTGLVGLVTYIDPEGEQRYSFIVGEGQGTIQSQGLSTVMDAIVTKQVSDAFLLP